VTPDYDSPSAAKAHRERVRRLGCAACALRERPDVPALIHHARFPVGGSQRSSDWYAIPLCHEMHRNDGPFGESIHRGSKTFQGKYGSERELLSWVYHQLDYPPPPELARELVLCDYST